MAWSPLGVVGCLQVMMSKLNVFKRYLVEFMIAKVHLSIRLGSMDFKASGKSTSNYWYEQYRSIKKSAESERISMSVESGLGWKLQLEMKFRKVATLKLLKGSYFVS